MLLMLYSNKVESNQHQCAGKIKVTKTVESDNQTCRVIRYIVHALVHVITMATHYK